ncbi:MAG: hypothetical protein JEZ07_18805 [Phycisphaerae bacterium]|nr:hypothetical protein [Phycisphaerae bacterium]
MRIKNYTIILLLAFCVPAMATNLDGTWYTGSKYGTPSLSATNSNTFTWGTGEVPDSTCATKGALWSYFPDIALDTIGDKITLDFTMIINDDVTSANQLRFGLFNDGATRVEKNLPGNNADSGFLSTFGYWSEWTTTGGTMNLRGRIEGATNPTSGSNSVLMRSLGGFAAMTNGVEYNCTLTIARINDTQFQITGTFADSIISTTTTMIDTTIFNTFCLLNPITGIGSITFKEMKVIYNDWANTPYPVSGGVDIELDNLLSWSAGTDPNDVLQVNHDITKHFLYGNLANPDDPNMYFITELPVGTTTYTPTELQRDKTYKWRIDESVNNSSKDDPATIIGMEWTFETLLSVPEIVSQPQGLYMHPGTEASFTVIANNPFEGDSTGLSYQWYRGSPGDTANPVGTDSDTYTIPSVQVDPDEGTYYCIITLIDNGKTSESSDASLVIKRLFAHWPFDGNANDIANDYDGTEFGEPTYGEGLIGQAIFLDGQDAAVIHEFPEALVLPQFTVALWVNTGNALQASSTGVFNNNSDVLDFQFDISAGQFRYNGSAIGNLGIIDPNTWAQVAVTCDGETSKLYFNGEWVAYGNFTDNNFGQLAVGVNREGTNFFQGMVDDLRAYNYALTDTEMALLFTDEMGGEICVAPPIYDLNEDCRVNLIDFSRFAVHWLDCGIVPDCLP